MFKVQIIFKGNVQGVFFRSHVKEFADILKITGYVKNLKDGSVEVIAIGDKNTLEKFIKEIEKKPGHGKIESIEKKYLTKTDAFSSFEIVY